MTNTELLIQAGAFGSPILATLLVFLIKMWRGKKTKINGSFLAGLELIDLTTWVPDNIVHPLMSGFAVATLMSATILTEWSKENDASMGPK